MFSCFHDNFTWHHVLPAKTHGIEETDITAYVSPHLPLLVPRYFMKAGTSAEEEDNVAAAGAEIVPERA
jgi:hypothetical protein